jgi:putative nucleotidyltransferase with HDIG domain
VNARLSQSFKDAISALSFAIEMRDPYTSGHQVRVAKLATAIAIEMNLSEDIIEGILIAGTIHDIGKLSIPAELLSKPGKLTDLELMMIKTHPESGYSILSKIDFPWPVAEIVYQHHERIDGSGYPRNLKADEILIEAKILCVSDVVEAMSSHRPYRPALGIDKALNEILINKGIIYDLDVVDAAVKVFEKHFTF